MATGTIQLLKKGKTKEKNPSLSTMNYHEIGTMVENLTEVSAKAKALDLYNAVDQSYITLGGVLDAIYTNAWHQGYDGFKDYIEDTFGMKIRKAMYLINIYNTLIETGIPPETVEGIGWSKLRVITPIIDLANVEDIVALAKDMTVKQLIEYVKNYKGDDVEGDAGEEVAEEEEGGLTTFSVKLHDDQKETILDALSAAKESSGTEYDAVALEYICMDYLGGTGGSKEVMSLAQLMTRHTAKEIVATFEKIYPEAKISVTL